jgi:hypothetical protein
VRVRTVAQQAHADAHAFREAAMWIGCGYAADNDKGAGSGPRSAFRHRDERGRQLRRPYAVFFRAGPKVERRAISLV